jgi:hypothetical protein
MNVIDLLARLNGEILSNKARAVVDGKIVILARMEGVDWVYTIEGQDLANLHSNLVAEEAAAKPKRAKKPAEAVVEQEPTPEAPVAVESVEVAPEQ